MSARVQVTLQNFITFLARFQTPAGLPLHRQHNHLLMQHGEMRHSATRSCRVNRLPRSWSTCTWWVRRAHLEFHHWYPWHDIGALAFGSVYPRTIQEKCSANGHRANKKNRLDWPSFSPVNMKSLERLRWYAHSCILTDSRQIFRSDFLRYIWYFLASNLSLFPTLLLPFMFLSF